MFIRKRMASRKPNPFTSKLLAQTQQVILGAGALRDYLNTPTRQNAIRVHTSEKQADAIRCALIQQLNHTFITPIDREDLFSLSRAIDDILDHIYSTMRELYLFKVQPNGCLRKMVELLYNSAEETYRAIEHLDHQPHKAGQHALSVLKLENHIDELYAEALAEMFNRATSPDDILNLLKMREIYQHLHHAAKGAEHAANLINDVLIKLY